MRDFARVQAVIELLCQMEASPIPMDNTIRDFMSARRYIGSKDRTWIVESLYRIVRSRARIDWWIGQGCSHDLSQAEEGGEEKESYKVRENTARKRVLADLFFHGKKTPEDISALFSGEKHAPFSLNEDEKHLLDAWKGKDFISSSMPVFVRVECPLWAQERLESLFEEDFERQVSCMSEPAGLDLRVNTLKASVEDVQESLRSDGINTQRCVYSPVGLRVLGKPFMGDTKAFKNGCVEIQDEGSQLIALISGAKPGMRVLDYCAGGGGKTLALAAMMKNKGNIVAMDMDARRLEKGRPRYKKAGVHNVELRCLKEEQSRKWLRRQKESMDVVLVDAPCSSSGTWRRNPDLRWRQYGPSVDEIVALQGEILDKVADKVKVGGRLVYATCSLFEEENEKQVEAFLDRHHDFSVLPIAQIGPDVAALPCEGDFLRLFPADHGTDGFFAVVLVKK